MTAAVVADGECLNFKTHFFEHGVELVNLYFVLIATVTSAIICHFIAKHRGLNSVYWGSWGLFIGPLAIPFVCLVKPKVAVNN